MSLACEYVSMLLAAVSLPAEILAATSVSVASREGQTHEDDVLGTVRGIV